MNSDGFYCLTTASVGLRSVRTGTLTQGFACPLLPACEGQRSLAWAPYSRLSRLCACNLQSDFSSLAFCRTQGFYGDSTWVCDKHLMSSTQLPALADGTTILHCHPGPKSAIFDTPTPIPCCHGHTGPCLLSHTPPFDLPMHNHPAR